MSNVIKFCILMFEKMGLCDIDLAYLLESYQKNPKTNTSLYI